MTKKASPGNFVYDMINRYTVYCMLTMFTFLLLKQPLYFKGTLMQI